MALTEEQRNPWRAIVAGGDYNLTSQDWEDLLTELDSLYTEAPIAQPASAPSEQKPVALPFAIFDQEMADLRRFHECVTDGEGYDVPKDRMKRLAEIGLVRRVSANYYEHTDFGLSVLNGDFDAEPKTDYKAQRDALLKSLEEALECGEDGDWQSARRVLVSAIASVKGGA